MKTALFQCGHCWAFQICCHMEGSTFTASSFRIWNRSTGIPSPPLALFVVMVPKAHLTSHSTMPGSRWVITPSWLSGSWSTFFYSSSVYSCHLFLVWPQVNNREGIQPHPSTENWIKDSLNMALPHQNSFPYGQFLPSGSFHSPLILLHQRGDRLKTTITGN